jgi:hypothetical protein
MSDKSPSWKVRLGSEMQTERKWKTKGGAKKKAAEKGDGRVARGGMP